MNRKLGSKVVSASFWVFVLRIFKQIFGFLKIIILAKLLDPSIFGLVGLAMLSLDILETFSQTGFQSALIQKKEGIKEYLDSTWTFLAIRGLFLFALLVFTAPIVARFFDTPQSTPIIQMVAVSFLFQGFSNIGLVYLQKELDFKKQFLYETLGVVFDFSLSILIAVIYRNVWALVVGKLVGDLIRTLMGFVVVPYRPRISFNFAQLRPLFKFGKWVMGSSILIFLLTHGDDLFLTKVLGVTALAFYQMAYKISNMPATEITHVISSVTFPAYAIIQNDLGRLKNSYLRVLNCTIWLTFPLTVLIFLFIDEFVVFFMGNKWLPIVLPTKILVIGGCIRSIGATIGPFFHAIGRPKVLTKAFFVQTIILFVMIYPFMIRWGIFGACAAVVIPGFIINLVLMVNLCKLIRCNFRDLVLVFKSPFLSAVFIFIILKFLKTLLVMNFIQIIFLSIFGVAVYVLLTNYFERNYVSNLISFIKNSKRQREVECESV